MPSDIETRLLACERSSRRQRFWIAGLSLLCAGLIVATSLGAAIATQATPGVLRVSELVVVDPLGVERVRIGGDLPDAVIDGKPVPRGSKAAGVMLYDRSGQERGGYVTFDTGDNIALTLDGRKGQNALFVAGPDGSVAVQLWHGAEAIELRADGNGARMTHSRHGAMTLQQPLVAALGKETCGLFRDGLRSEVPEGLSREQVHGICGRRFSAEACSACLDRE